MSPEPPHSISVIVPVYRAEKELPRCVDSLLAQDYPLREIILVNDGSPDNSGAICDRYAAADSRVRVCHQENAGVSAARNKGMAEATGDYLCFVDADDEVEPGYIRAFAEGLAPGVDLVFQGICEIYNGQSKRKVPPRKRFAQGQLTEGIALINKQSMFGYVCNKLYRRSIIAENNLQFRRDISLSEDRIFALEYMRHAREMQLTDTCAYRYYLQSSGQTMRRRSYEELIHAAEANLAAAQALLLQQPSAAFLRDTRRMYVMSAMGALSALFQHREPMSRCVSAFRAFLAVAQEWLPLYQPSSLNHRLLYAALHCPLIPGVAGMKLYQILKDLNHAIRS